MDINENEQLKNIFALITVPTFFILLFYMLADAYSQNKKQLPFLILVPPYVWLYYLVFFKQNELTES